MVPPDVATVIDAIKLGAYNVRDLDQIISAAQTVIEAKFEAWRAAQKDVKPDAANPR